MEVSRANVMVGFSPTWQGSKEGGLDILNYRY